MSDLSILTRVILVLSIFGCGGFSTTTAWAADLYEVSGVNVDATAITATKAREQALADGEREAFARLLQRLTLAADRDRLPQPDQRELATYVRDFAVSNEKSSAGRYLASMSVRFNRDAVHKLLTDLDLPFAETVSSGVLVLPVFQADGSLALWDDPNPWRDAWATSGGRGGLVPLVRPLGDIGDVGMISPTQAVQGDRPRLQRIAGRYGVSDVIVIYGLQRLDPTSQRQSLEVYVTRYDKDPDPQTETYPFNQQEGESAQGLLRRAVAKISNAIEDAWKIRNVLDLKHPNVAAVAVPVSGLQDWIAVQTRLESVPLVRRIEMVLLSLDEVRINLHYVGDIDQLRNAMTQAKLNFLNEDGEWVLYLAGARPAAGSGN